MRVLLSAYAFSPYRGSESAVGWNIAMGLAKYCDVTVICGDVEGKQEVWHDLDRWRREGGAVPNLHFAYVGPSRLMMAIEKLHHLPGCWALYYLAYRLWQHKAYKHALVLHREHPFDLVHHVTMIGYREPGYMWKLPIPFVWGPVGGSPNEPIGYWSIYSAGAKVNVLLRNILNGLQKRFMLRPRCAAKKASMIWAVTDADVYTIRDVWGRTCEKMVETAATPVEGALVRSYRADDVFRIVWSGTHTYGKALSILIKALSQMIHSRPQFQTSIHVDVLGRGPETANWQAMAKREGVAECFAWRGYLPHEDALKIMNEAHILVFTSVKEGTPHVVLEAMAMGLPIVCHDACGMGVAVTERCGIKVPMVDPKTSVNGFADAIAMMMAQPDCVRQFSEGCVARAKELTWGEKTRDMYNAYKGILEV